MVSAPVDMQAPTIAYTVFYALFVASMVPIVAWMAHQSWRQRSIVPLAALGGGLLTGMIVPPIYNHLTLVWFPSNIPLPFVTSFGMKDPWFDALGYALFIGFGGYILYRQFLDGQGARAVYAAFVLWGITDLVLELPFLAAGLYAYYGDQPFLVGGFPLHWVAMNGLVPVLSGMLMYVFLERWPTGRRGAAWRVVATPTLAGALLMIPIFPVAAALNAEVPTAVRWVAAAVSIAICLLGLVKLARLAEREIAVPGKERGLVSLMMGMSRGGPVSRDQRGPATRPAASTQT